MMRKRLGRFSIPREFIEHDSEQVKRIMGECIILRCEYMYSKGCFEYDAQSEHFDEVTEGYEPPLYEIIVHDNFIEFAKTNGW